MQFCTDNFIHRYIQQLFLPRLRLELRVGSASALIAPNHTCTYILESDHELCSRNDSCVLTVARHYARHSRARFIFTTGQNARYTRIQHRDSVTIPNERGARPARQHGDYARASSTRNTIYLLTAMSWEKHPIYRRMLVTGSSRRSLDTSNGYSPHAVCMGDFLVMRGTHGSCEKHCGGNLLRLRRDTAGNSTSRLN